MEDEIADHVRAVEAYRADKDRYFGSSPDSPIEPTDREGFPGLVYFPVDPALRFEGLRLRPYGGGAPERFSIPTSDGRWRDALRTGQLEFQVGARRLTLVGYVLAGGDPRSLFEPFLDATSGTETYGAGRYLDFNLAYHPYCAYSERYSCPLTPAENRLPVRIETGERLP